MRARSVFVKRLHRHALAVALVALAGCTSLTRPYFELGVGYKLDSSSSLLTLPDCHTATINPDWGRDIGNATWGPYDLRSTSCGGRNPTAHIAAGVEFKPGSRVARWVSECGWYHWSHWRDGWPLDADRNYRELHVDELGCKKRWGGWRR